MDKFAALCNRNNGRLELRLHVLGARSESLFQLSEYVLKSKPGNHFEMINHFLDYDGGFEHMMFALQVRVNPCIGERMHRVQHNA